MQGRRGEGLLPRRESDAGLTLKPTAPVESGQPEASDPRRYDMHSSNNVRYIFECCVLRV